ncbi:carbonic anhydrase [Natronoarchaeum philippinense]|uniref:carbonic anhydrase n=1 Tax=Natronoarchaeum philippinense TaxID=558529 RepID=A0A285NS10_NATPI|nr:carbonic anhydrase [Natronoarchaeum philippinense]SNZ12239.1 carbonic anhydrase [Natronoarchaeum philippinense]
MARDIVRELLDRNREHTDSLPAGYFDTVRFGQQPPVVSVCCSDSRVSQEGMFDVDEPGYLFTASNIGNQTRDEHEGEFVVDGNIMYPVKHTDTRTIAVVGHTQCGAVTAAYNWVRYGDEVDHPGIRERVGKLVPIVENGLDSGQIDADAADAAVVDQLVEYNVNQQIGFLLDNADLSEDVSVYGFVYDFHGSYDDVDGRTYAVNADGEADPAAIRDLLSEEYEVFGHSLLGPA